jgi:hypothetical protein
VTDEGKKDTEGFVTATSMNKSWFGVSGIPHAALIDPTGKVVWDGHPSALDNATIEKSLVGALTKPVWEWPAAAKEARSALMKRKYADALAAAAKLTEADQGPSIKEAIERLVSSRVTAMKSALEEGNFLGAQDAANELAKSLDGLPEKADAEKVAAEVKANKDAERVIKAQKTLRELRNKPPTRSKDREKAMTDLKKIQKDLAGTFAAKEAEELQMQIRAAMQKK